MSASTGPAATSQSAPVATATPPPTTLPITSHHRQGMTSSGASCASGRSSGSAASSGLGGSRGPAPTPPPACGKEELTIRSNRITCPGVGGNGGAWEEETVASPATVASPSGTMSGSGGSGGGLVTPPPGGVSPQAAGPEAELRAEQLARQALESRVASLELRCFSQEGQLRALSKDLEAVVRYLVERVGCSDTCGGTAGKAEGEDGCVARKLLASALLKHLEEEPPAQQSALEKVADQVTPSWRDAPKTAARPVGNAEEQKHNPADLLESSTDPLGSSVRWTAVPASGLVVPAARQGFSASATRGSSPSASGGTVPVSVVVRQRSVSPTLVPPRTSSPTIVHLGQQVPVWRQHSPPPPATKASPLPGAISPPPPASGGNVERKTASAYHYEQPTWPRLGPAVRGPTGTGFLSARAGSPASKVSASPYGSGSKHNLPRNLNL